MEQLTHSLPLEGTFLGARLRVEQRGGARLVSSSSGGNRRWQVRVPRRMAAGAIFSLEPQQASPAPPARPGRPLTMKQGHALVRPHARRLGMRRMSPQTAAAGQSEAAAVPAADGAAASGPSGVAKVNVDVAGSVGSSKPKPVSYNYGFQAEFLRTGPSVPSNVFKLAFENFGREYLALRRNLLFEELSDVRTDNVKRTPRQLVLAYLGRFLVGTFRGIDKFLTLYDALPIVKPAEPLCEEGKELRRKLRQLTLSNEGVAEKERQRPPVPAPWWIMGPYTVLCWMLDVIFYNRPIQRFWFLETVARMPYFSYISMLHLYETLGWWRAGAEVRKVHFAEEWNEMNHLKIMESLGGDRLWIDRFFAQHAAFFYYWILNTMFLISPRVAYNFSELIEAHAVDTYGQFVDENEELLKTLPPPPAAIAYYNNEDLYMFDDFQTSRAPESRRPKMESLYDVFSAIRDDEGEHVKTMWACQQLDATVLSPHTAARLSSVSTLASASAPNGHLGQGDVAIPTSSEAENDTLTLPNASGKTGAVTVATAEN